MCVLTYHRVHVEVGGHCRCQFFYHIGSRGQTEITRLGDKHLYLLSHLAGPQIKLNYLIYVRVPVIFNDGM